MMMPHYSSIVLMAEECLFFIQRALLQLRCLDLGGGLWDGVLLILGVSGLKSVEVPGLKSTGRNCTCQHAYPLLERGDKPP